jgi:hypothetical protein
VGVLRAEGGYVRVLFHVKQTGREASGYLKEASFNEASFNEASFNEATVGVESHAFATHNSLLVFIPVNYR